MSEVETKVIKDGYVICPECFRPLEGYTMMAENYERTGCCVRNYFGWCEKCQVGFEVVQFRRIDSQRWFIHKYRPYSYSLTAEHPVPKKDWTIIKEMPELPLAMLGPGGDFDIPYNPNLEDAVQALINTLKNAVKVAESLLGIIKKTESKIPEKMEHKE